MGTEMCNLCHVNQNQQPQNLLLMQRQFSTMKDIQQRFRQYASDNMLGFYDSRSKNVIQNLFILQQIHICDLIIKLTCDKQNQDLIRILEDIENINLEQLDHLSLIGQYNSHVVSSMANSWTLYEHQNMRTTQRPELSLAENGQNSQFQGLEISKVQKEEIKNQTDVENGKSIIKGNKWIVIACVQCFNGIGAIRPLNIPSKKTPLRIFLQKIQLLNNQLNTNFQVIFIINPKFQFIFDEQLRKYHTSCRQQSDGCPQQCCFLKVIYRPCYPCVDNYGKIQINNETAIKYDYTDGDYVGFIVKNDQIQSIIGNYQYVQIANICNVMERVGDYKALGYFCRGQKIQIISLAVKKSLEMTGETQLGISNGFIEQIHNQYCCQQNSLELIHSYYLRSALLTTKGSNFQKLISSKIRCSKIGTNNYTFVRHFQNILFASFTLVLIVDASQKSSLNTAQNDYIRCSQKMLNITGQLSQQIAEVCPQILFGPKTHQNGVCQQKTRILLTYPIIVTKQGIVMMDSKQQQK